MLKKAKFTMDCWDGFYVDGYSYGDSWNGWACPLFTKINAMKIMQYVKSQGSHADYIKEFDTFLFRNDDEDAEAYVGHEYVTDGGVTKLYDIGCRSWIWDEVEVKPGDTPRRWHNFETMFPSLRDAMRAMLKVNGIKYELSEGSCFWHFEIFANDEEANFINDWLDTQTIKEVRN